MPSPKILRDTTPEEFTIDVRRPPKGDPECIEISVTNNGRQWSTIQVYSIEDLKTVEGAIIDFIYSEEKEAFAKAVEEEIREVFLRMDPGISYSSPELGTTFYRMVKLEEEGKVRRVSVEDTEGLVGIEWVLIEEEEHA